MLGKTTTNANQFGLFKTNDHRVPVVTSNPDYKLWTYQLEADDFSNFEITINKIRETHPNAGAVLLKLPEGYKFQRKLEDLQTIKIQKAFKMKIEKKHISSPVVLTHYSNDVKIDQNVTDFINNHANEPKRESLEEVINARKKAPGLYPLEIANSISNDNDHLNMRNLSDILGIFRIMAHEVTGVTTPLIYVGLAGTLFPFHLEDMNLHSLNIMFEIEDLDENKKGSKYWIAIDLRDSGKFQGLIQKSSKTKCPFEIRGKATFPLSLEELAKAGIRFQLLKQSPGYMIITFGIHGGWNSGVTLNEAVNIASLPWLGLFFNKMRDSDIKFTGSNNCSCLYIPGGKGSKGSKREILHKAQDFRYPDCKVSEEDKLLLQDLTYFGRLRMVRDLFASKLEDFFSFIKSDNVAKDDLIFLSIVHFFLRNPEMSIFEKLFWEKVRRAAGSFDASEYLKDPAIKDRKKLENVSLEEYLRYEYRIITNETENQKTNWALDICKYLNSRSEACSKLFEDISMYRYRPIKDILEEYSRLIKVPIVNEPVKRKYVSDSTSNSQLKPGKNVKLSDPTSEEFCDGSLSQDINGGIREDSNQLCEEPNVNPMRVQHNDTTSPSTDDPTQCLRLLLEKGLFLKGFEGLKQNEQREIFEAISSKMQIGGDKLPSTSTSSQDKPKFKTGGQSKESMLQRIGIFEKISPEIQKQLSLHHLKVLAATIECEPEESDPHPNFSKNSLSYLLYEMCSGQTRMCWKSIQQISSSILSIAKIRTEPEDVRLKKVEGLISNLSGEKYMGLEWQVVLSHFMKKGEIKTMAEKITKSISATFGNYSKNTEPEEDTSREKKMTRGKTIDIDVMRINFVVKSILFSGYNGATNALENDIYYQDWAKHCNFDFNANLALPICLNPIDNHEENLDTYWDTTIAHLEKKGDRLFGLKNDEGRANGKYQRIAYSNLLNYIFNETDIDITERESNSEIGISQSEDDVEPSAK